jgi:hypothetical protein
MKKALTMNTADKISAYKAIAARLAAEQFEETKEKFEKK